MALVDARLADEPAEATRQAATAPAPSASRTHALRVAVERGDFRWLGAVALVLGVLCALPYLLSALAGPPGLAREGTFWFIKDYTQYQAAMREGAESASWLIHDHFTAEPHQPILMYPLYVGMGKLAALLGVSADGVFAAMEWLGRAALLGALAAFVATWTSDRRTRRLALLLAVGTLGLAGWAVPARFALQGLGRPDLVRLLPPSVNVYLEISSFGVFFSAPHLMLGLALTLLAAPVYLRAQARGGWWLLMLAALIGVLSLVHPFNLPVVVSILGVDGLLRVRWSEVRRRRPLDWQAFRPLLPGIASGLVAAPMALYNFALFQLDPFWRATYGVQNLMPAPPPWSLPVDFGVVLLAAPLAWSAVRRWPGERRRLLLLWVGLSLAWLYVPVPYQRRFAFGLQPALAVLSGAGLLWLNERLRRTGRRDLWRRATNDLVLVAVLMTPVLVYASLVSSALTNAPAQVYLWTKSEEQAGAWLGRHSSAADVVMASTDYANALAGVIDGRVVHGHIVATRDSNAKIALVKAFYAAGATASQRSAALRASGATLVALGPDEEKLGGSAAALDALPDLHLIYDRDGVRFYRVQAPSGA